MFIVITPKRMVIAILSLLIPIFIFAVDMPESPSVPDVTGPVIEDIEQDDLIAEDEEADDNIFHQSVWKTAELTVEGDSLLIGTIELTTNIFLIVSNTNENYPAEFGLYLNNITSVEVIKWTASVYLDSIFKFIPSEYLINDSYFYTGNIDIFNVFKITANQKETVYYTLFYDKWSEGDSGYFYWENTLAYDFSYNFTHPFVGVVTRIELSDIE